VFFVPHGTYEQRKRPDRIDERSTDEQRDAGG
jgi:hypothetical protein